jgi:GDP-4-dehydro-6-deoxy-D-mannose reductase
MKAFVTGASGFAGRALVAHLQDTGDHVIGTDRGGETGVDIVDRDAIHAAIARANPDVVYHLAAFTHVGESFEQPALARLVNIDGTANVFDACHAAGVGRVVAIGSAEEYGAARTDELPLREDTPLRPTSPYAVSKIAASYLAVQAWLAHGLEVVRVRPFNHTGPGQSPQFLVPALAHRIAAAERDDDGRVMIGATDPVRDLNDVRDVVRAYRLLSEHGQPGDVYNVCSGTAVSVGEIAERLLARARRPLALVTDPGLVRAVDVPALIGDPTKLRAATGWEPQYTLDQTLADVLDDARRRVLQPPI